MDNCGCLWHKKQKPRLIHRGSCISISTKSLLQSNLQRHTGTFFCYHLQEVNTGAELDNNNDYKPVYVGISKSILDRKREHLIRTDKGTATLALNIAREVKHILPGEKDPQKIVAGIKKVQEEYLKNLWITVHPYPLIQMKRISFCQCSKFTWQ